VTGGVQPWRPPRYTNANFAEEQRLCYQLRLRGLSIRQIADETGMSPSTVHRRIECEIRETVQPLAEQVRALELDRLDQLQQVALAVMNADHPLVSDGRVVRTELPDGTKVALQDHGPVLAAMDRFLKIQDRRAKLLGLDAAVKVDATVVETTQLDIEAAEMVAEAKAKAAAAEARLRENADG
jgi:AcrR family transcriptional regulator